MRTPEELKAAVARQEALNEAETARVDAADKIISAAMDERPSQKEFIYPRVNLDNLTNREINELTKRAVAAGWKVEVTNDNIILKQKRTGGRKPGSKNKPKANVTPTPASDTPASVVVVAPATEQSTAA